MYGDCYIKPLLEIVEPGSDPLSSIMYSLLIVHLCSSVFGVMSIFAQATYKVTRDLKTDIIKYVSDPLFFYPSLFVSLELKF